MTNFKEVKISEIFLIEKWKALYTKTFINENKWDFPVYSSQTVNYWIIGSINKYDFSKNCITWTTDWIHAWTVFLRKNVFFSMTTHCWAIFIKDKYEKNILLEYIFNILKLNLKLFTIWDTNKRITSWMIKEIIFKIPIINQNWEFDLEKQKEIAYKYEKIEKIKDRLRIMKENLEDKNLIFKFIWNYEEVSINKIFDLQRWKSLYTKQYWNDNKWEFPVYSARKEQLTSIKTFDFDWEYLTWATNWFAWYLKRINWKFSINADRWIFIPKTQNIDIDFIIYSIQWDLRNLTKWRIWDKWKNEFTKLSPDKIKDNILVKIPITNTWEFDLKKQQEIAFKYEKIEKIQKTLIEELEYLEKVKVEI